MKKIVLLLSLMLISSVCFMQTASADLKNDLNEVIVYPNPARTAVGNNQVTFDNLTADVTIKIFRVNTGLVKEIKADNTNGKVVWDLTNDGGEKVGSAVYIYLVTNSNGQKIKGKLAIIR